MKLRVTRDIDIPDERIRDLLCAGLEGGIGYWGTITEYHNPDNIECEFKHLDLPMSAHGYIRISENEDPDDKGRLLHKQTIEDGLKAMSERFQNHFDTFMAENEDAETGDVFIQCCLYDDVIFG